MNDVVQFGQDRGAVGPRTGRTGGRSHAHQLMDVRRSGPRAKATQKQRRAAKIASFQLKSADASRFSREHGRGRAVAICDYPGAVRYERLMYRGRGASAKPQCCDVLALNQGTDGPGHTMRVST
jgi:hypothetical protein